VLLISSFKRVKTEIDIVSDSMSFNENLTLRCDSRDGYSVLILNMYGS